MVIEEYQSGQTTIRIHDDCMAKTVEENNAIVGRIEKLVTRQYQLKRMKTSEETA